MEKARWFERILSIYDDLAQEVSYPTENGFVFPFYTEQKTLYFALEPILHQTL